LRKKQNSIELDIMDFFAYRVWSIYSVGKNQYAYTRLAPRVDFSRLFQNYLEENQNQKTPATKLNE
jgi:hypothetical protein